jgi:hypothetical protein
MKPNQVQLLKELQEAQPITVEMIASLEAFLEEVDSTEEVVAFLKRLVATAFLEKEALEQSMALSTIESTIVGYGRGTIAAYGVYVGEDGTSEQIKLAEQAQQNWVDVTSSILIKAVDDSIVDGRGLQALAVKAQSILASKEESPINKTISQTMLGGLSEVTKQLLARTEPSVH